MDVDLLLDELDAGERYAEGGLCGIDVVGGGLVEARLFDAQLIGLRLAGRPGAASGVVGGQAQRSLCRLLDGDLSGGDDDAVLVDDGEDDGLWVCADKVLGRARHLGGRGLAGGEQYSECDDSTLQAWHAIQIR